MPRILVTALILATIFALVYWQASLFAAVASVAGTASVALGSRLLGR